MSATIKIVSRCLRETYGQTPNKQQQSMKNLLTGSNLEENQAHIREILMMAGW